MKKVFVLAIILSVFLQVDFVSAYSESRDGLGKVNPLATLIQKKNQEKHDNAVWTRYKNYFMGKVRNRDDKNLDLQKAVHAQSKRDGNVTGRATEMNREGELKSVPYYAEHRPVSLGTYERKNSKQIFRKRAIDYYVDGGYAGTNSLRSDVIYGSNHEVRKVIGRKYGWLVGSIIAPVRDMQRRLTPEVKESAPYVGSTHKVGSSHRNYIHPYMPAIE